MKVFFGGLLSTANQDKSSSDKSDSEPLISAMEMFSHSIRMGRNVELENLNVDHVGRRFSSLFLPKAKLSNIRIPHRRKSTNERNAIKKYPSLLTSDRNRQDREEETEAILNRMKVIGVTRNTWSVHPDDEGYQKWFLFTMLLVTYNSFSLPFDFAFNDRNVDSGGGDDFTNGGAPLMVFETLIDFVFIADVFIRFKVGYIDENGVFISEKDQIAKQYIYHGSFFVDVISCIPFELMASVSSSFSSPSIFYYLSLCKTFEFCELGVWQNIYPIWG